MQNIFEGAFMRKDMISERLISRTSELWGVENPGNVDPLVRLLLDVMAFELADLGAEMTRHNGKMLHNLAEMLVPGPWLLPRPAHAIMHALPLEPESVLRTSDQFYIPLREKNVSGEEHVTDIFFAPLIDVNLVKAKLDLFLLPGKLVQRSDSGHEHPIASHLTTRPGYNEIWLGLDPDTALEEIESLGVYLELPSNVRVEESLLSQIKWTDHSGEVLHAKPMVHPEMFGESSRYDKEHFALANPENVVLDDVAAHYRKRLFTLHIPEKKIRIQRTAYPEALKSILSEVDPQVFETPRYWIQLCFPAAIGPNILRACSLDSNCFPIVNRRRHQVRHRLHSGSNIIPLFPPEESNLLSIASVADDTGRALHKQTLSSSRNQSDSYTIYKGHLERFDRTTAEEMLSRLLRLIREESSIFAAYGQEIMLRQMSDLRNNLATIHEQLDISGSKTTRERNYLLAFPNKEARYLEVEFWSVSRLSNHRALKQNTPILQYKQISIQPGSARLQTDLIPGKPAPNEEEKVSAFRYGLLTRDRIVSREDIRKFVFHALGEWINQVEIRNGVAISSDKKRGLVRIVEVVLHPSAAGTFDEKDWKVHLEGLTESLNRRSVHSVEYRIILKTEKPKVHVDHSAQ